MFINENSVAIAFKLINFMALVGLVLFVFKKYAKKDILSLMDQEEAQHNALLVEQKNLEMQQYDLDRIIKKENLACEQFKATIDEWKKVALHEKSTQEKERHAFTSAIKQRHAQLALHKENTRIQNATIDIMIATLDTRLSDKIGR